MISPIVDTTWLDDHPEAVLVDVRWYTDGRSGLESYERSHLPGAIYLDLDRWLAAPASPAEGRHPLPDPEVFAEGMRQAGIADTDVVVAYDDDSGAIAARLVWMLRVTGHQAALLDGGYAGWRGRREHGATSRPPATFAATPWPADRLAGIDDVAAAGATLLDARPAGRYRGESDSLDARPGHIPGAKSLPCRDNVDHHGALLPLSQLRSRLAALGVDRQAEWISSCG
ncbi:MAG: putative thiosulfate sulfurtransferase, partial [Frankiales bacterium]|nr:putative thiosulfate sulfurtransferase [Frankiales bacterium]